MPSSIRWRTQIVSATTDTLFLKLTTMAIAFPLSDRFAHLKTRGKNLYLNSINAELSRKFWAALVDERYSHLCAIPMTERETPLYRMSLDANDPAAGRRALVSSVQSILGTRANQSVMHFWSPEHAVLSRWAFFTRYWDDFWYPSDDNNALVFLEQPLRIEYVEEQLLFFRPL